MSVTIKRSLPIKALIKLDFPAFGRPTTAKRGKTTSSWTGSGFTGNASINASSKSPVPLPEMLANVKYSPKPKL